MGNKQSRGFHIFRRKGKKNVVKESSKSSEEVTTLPRQSDNLQDEKQHCDREGWAEPNLRGETNCDVTRVSSSFPEHGSIAEQTPKDDIQPSLTVYADVAHQSEESEVSLCDVDNTIDQPAAHFDGSLDPQATPTDSTEDVGGGLSGANTESGANKLGHAKRRSRKKEQRHKRQQSFTVYHILDKLKEVNWETLKDVLEIHSTQRKKIENDYSTERERKRAAVRFWFWNHPYASWRLLITRLDWLHKHTVASRLYRYSERLTDPTFTRENVSKVIAMLSDGDVALVLDVPVDMQVEFQKQSFSSGDFDYRRRLIDYFMRYSHYANWSEISSRLYREEHHEAEIAARVFDSRMPDPSLTLENVTALFENVNLSWDVIRSWLDIPISKHGSVLLPKHQDSGQRTLTCLNLYLTEHPSPSWKPIAYILYYHNYPEVLEVVQKKYLKGTAENRRQFAEAMKFGHVKAWLCKMLMYGAAGSGKSTTKEMIVGNPPPENRESTPLAARPTTVYRINLDEKEWAKISSLEERRAFLARALVQCHMKREQAQILTVNLGKSELSLDDITQLTDMLKKELALEYVNTMSLKSIKNGGGSTTVVSYNIDGDVPPTLLSEKFAGSDSESISSEESIEDTVDRFLESISTDEELVKMMDRLSTTVHPRTAFRILQIIDSGGQPQFHEILPIFMRRLYFYVFVFRLCDELGSRPMVEYYVGGESVATSFASTQTIEQLLQHCARAMHSQESDKDESPRILVMGTHLDQEGKSSETREEKNMKILKLLQQQMLGKQIIYHNAGTNEVIFPVNAKTPGKEEEKIVEQIREILLGESSIPAADIPLKWFALEILLQEMVQACGRGVLSVEECFSAAAAKLHFEDHAEFDAAVQYLDDLSVLFHYPKILSNVIFADLQILLDKVTELVLAFLQKKDGMARGDDWRKFYEFALVTAEFLSQKEFSKHYVPDLFEVKELIELFKKLLIFAQFDANQLFVPALLRDLGKDEVDKHRNSSCIVPSLVVQFPEGGPRKGIFCSLLCWLVSSENESQWSISTNEIGTPTCLHRNCVQLEISDSPGTVTLIDTYTHFEVHVDIPDESADDLCPEMFPAIRESIFKGIHKATINLGYYSSTPKSALVCPCRVGEAHVATTNLKIGYWTCALDKSKCGKLSPHQLLWVDSPSADHDRKRLAESDLPALLDKLNSHASKWRDIGIRLGFLKGELDNIEARPLLLNSAPESWLREMLSEWLQWAPEDGRGSSSFATLDALKIALSNSGLGATASCL